MRAGPSLAVRHGRSRSPLAIATLFLAIGLVALLPAGASAAATPYGTNLVKNPGAENGLNHWETFPDGDFKTHAYVRAGLGFPSKATSNAIGGGTYFFYAGLYDNAYGTCADAQQQWTLTGIGAAIDGGHVKATLKGYVATNGGASIHAHLDLYFRDANNHSVASNGITRKASSTNEQYVHVNTSKVLSRHTRILRIHLWADGDDPLSAGDCAAFWDKLSVVLTHI